MSTPTASDDDIFISADTLIMYDCQHEIIEHLKNHSNFIKNAKGVVDDIVANASKEEGYKFATYSEFGNPSAYGIAQCRANVVRNGINCSSCLANATITMNNKCFESAKEGIKGAIVVREECLLMYSDQNFFGQTNNYVDLNSKFCDGDAPHDEELLQTTFFLLQTLISDDRKTTMFGSRATRTGNGSFVDVMVECRRDLTAHDCHNCITTAANQLLNNTLCTGKAVRKLFLPSCSVKIQWE